MKSFKLNNQETQEAPLPKDVLVSKILYKGFTKLLASPLQVGSLKRNEKCFGALTGFIQGYCCPRCNKNFGYIHTSPDGMMFFCGELDCLVDDSKSSKAMARNEFDSRNQEEDAAHRFSLGSRYTNASLARWNINSQHANLVNSWIKNPKNMLVLTGNPNTGKTYFCVAIANYLMLNKKSVRYYNSRRFIEEIQRGIEQNKNQYESVKRIASADYLILDDLGASTNSEWQQEMVLDLIDHRYSNNLPTIITSNFDKKAFQEALGERTARRIFSKENLVLTLGAEYAR